MTNLSLPQITKELSALEIKLARRDQIAFTRYTFPAYDVNWHHERVAVELDQILAGTNRRLIILEPPQCGKSEQVSRRFPAFAFGRKPNLRIIACSYSDSLAQDMSRDVQRIMSSEEYHTLFPGTRLAEGSDPEKKTQGQFDIVGHRGYYIAAGINGSITGKSADVGIIDDPIKNRAEAESETYRKRVWEQYKSAFATRQFGNKGAIIICLTRWHEDDLVGRLLELSKENPDAEQWRMVSFPAIATEVRPGDPRAPGEALWPKKYPLDELNRRRIGLGEYDWSALYQQQPTPSGGGLFKEEWFAGKFVDAAPAIMRVVRCWDTAGTEEGGDWTVGVKLGEEFTRNNFTGALESTGRFFILDVVRKQLGPDGVDKLMRVTAELDGRSCAVREEREGGSSGPAVITARTRTLRGFDYGEMPIAGKSKVMRSKPFRAQAEAGNIYLLRAPWNKVYIDELTSFPTGKHDDQVDGSSGAFNAVLLEPAPQEEFVAW